VILSRIEDILKDFFLVKIFYKNDFFSSSIYGTIVSFNEIKIKIKK